MKNIYQYLTERLYINKDVKIEPEKPIKVPRMLMGTYVDERKMREYRNKGSKPQRLVNSIKDNEKLKRRFRAAQAINWPEALEVFGQAIIDRKLFTRDEMNAWFDKYYNGKIKL